MTNGEGLIERLHEIAGSQKTGFATDAVAEAATALSEQAKRIEVLEEALTTAEAEARRFAGFYPEASDGRNTFVIFADKIAALKSGA